jgi:hypothetical protein
LTGGRARRSSMMASWRMVSSMGSPESRAEVERGALTRSLTARAGSGARTAELAQRASARDGASHRIARAV